MDYDTGVGRRYPARLVRAIVLDNVTRPLTHLVASPEVRGDEVLDLVEPPAIFVANHTSHVDTPLLLSVLPTAVRHKTVVAAAADHFFDRRWKAHLWALLAGRRSPSSATASTAARPTSPPSSWATAGTSSSTPRAGAPPTGGSRPCGAAPPTWPPHGPARRPRALDGHLPHPPQRRGPPAPQPDSRHLRLAATVADGEDARRFGARIDRVLATMADEAAHRLVDGARRAAAGTTPSPTGPRCGAVEGGAGRSGPPRPVTMRTTRLCWALSDD